jgi:hypothetical protein
MVAGESARWRSPRASATPSSTKFWAAQRGRDDKSNAHDAELRQLHQRRLDNKKAEREGRIIKRQVGLSHGAGLLSYPILCGRACSMP